eukprot:9448295-Pyramimonas_sp.AAC.2
MSCHVALSFGRVGRVSPPGSSKPGLISRPAERPMVPVRARGYYSRGSKREWSPRVWDMSE